MRTDWPLCAWQSILARSIHGNAASSSPSSSPSASSWSRAGAKTFDGTNALVIVGSNYRLTLCGCGVCDVCWGLRQAVGAQFSRLIKRQRSIRVEINIGGGEGGQRLRRLWTKINKIDRSRSKRWSSSTWAFRFWVCEHRRGRVMTR